MRKDLIKINYTEIEDEITICPYCGDEYGEKFGCCGESSCHAERAYVMRDGDVYSEHEVWVYNDRTMEDQLNETLHKHYWRSVRAWGDYVLRCEAEERDKRDGKT